MTAPRQSATPAVHLADPASTMVVTVTKDGTTSPAPHTAHPQRSLAPHATTTSTNDAALHQVEDDIWLVESGRRLPHPPPSNEFPTRPSVHRLGSAAPVRQQRLTICGLAHLMYRRANNAQRLVGCERRGRSTAAGGERARPDDALAVHQGDLGRPLSDLARPFLRTGRLPRTTRERWGLNLLPVRIARSSTSHTPTRRRRSAGCTQPVIPKRAWSTMTDSHLPRAGVIQDETGVAGQVISVQSRRDYSRQPVAGTGMRVVQGWR